MTGPQVQTEKVRGEVEVSRSRKIAKILSLLVLLAVTILPVPAISEKQESNSPVTESTTQLLEDSIDPYEELESGTMTTEPIVNPTESSEQSEEKTEETFEEEQIESSNVTSETESTNERTRQARANSTDTLLVLDWQLLKNEIAVSETVHAVTGEAYELTFNWEVKNSTLSPGDFVTYRLPYNRGAAGDDIGASGSWRTSSSAQAVPLTATVDGQTIKYAEWFIEAYDGGVDYEQIRIQFTDEVRLLSGMAIEATISTGVDSIKNYTYRGGIQKVEFAGIQKAIDFSQDRLEKSPGWNYKNAMGASVNQIQFDIPVNLPASLELGGDTFDYSKHSEGWAFDPMNPENGWGEQITDIHDIYVEDTLDEGVLVHNLMIIANARAPMQLPPNALTDYRGGIVATLPAFNSYLLVDFGNGPIYRTPNDPISERQLPKQEYSFQRVYQEEGESIDSFRTRVKSQAYQYGLFFDEATNRQTVMTYFGDVKKVGDRPKYSDLTDQRYTDPPKEIAGSRTDAVFSFAEQAASRLITNGHYTEADREELEAYFTLVYGDNNALGGQVATFEISFNAQYPPGTTSGEKVNTARYFYTGPQDPNFPILPEVTGTYNLTNPYSSVQLSSNEAMLFKFTEQNLPLNGAKFELQRERSTDQWETVPDSAVTTGTVAVNVLEGGSVVGRQLDGGAKLTNLENGTYRFVEVEPPDGYDPELSPNYNDEVEKVVSDEFTIPSSGQRSIVFVANHAQPKYSVQHYVQTSPDDESEAGFELRLQENFNGKSGTEVTAVGKSFAGYRLDETLPYTVSTGRILEDGSLILKLYYVKDETNQPFYFYKYDENKHPMPSIDFKGDPLGEDKEVSFDVYRYNNKGWSSGADYAPTEVVPTSGKKIPNSEENVWEKVETLTSDSNGKVSSRTLSLTDEDGGLMTYAVVEKKTYEGYRLPDSNHYWVLWTNNIMGENQPQVPPFISGITPVNGAPTADAINPSDPENLREYYVMNHYEKWSISKVDVLGNAMPSYDTNGNPLGENKQVTFDWYRYVGSWSDGTRPDEVAPGESGVWEKQGTLETDANGKLVGDAIPRYSGAVLGLVETSTYKGYHLPSAKQAYWVLWEDGNFSNCGTDNPGSLQKAAYHHVIKNDYRTEMQLYKTDARTGYPLRRTETAKVGFRYYRYVGSWEGEGPTTNTDLSDTGNWQPMKNLQDDTYLFYADEEGKLTGLEETLVGAYPYGHTYAIQEVEAYPGYQKCPGFWIVYLNENKKAKSYTIDGMNYIGEGNLIVAPEDPNNQLNAYQLTNEPLPYPDLVFIKINDNHTPLANVEFELFKPKGDVPFNEQTEKDGSYWEETTSYPRQSSSLSGRVIFPKLPKGIYLLKEIKTAPGYQLPEGDWLIQVDPEAEQPITIQARKETTPPAFKRENDQYYLPNYRKHGIPFTGKWGKVFLLVIGILLIGAAGLVKVKRPLNS